MFGVNPLDQFAAIIDLILQQKHYFHVLVVNDMTMLITVDSNGTLMFIDSHVHGHLYQKMPLRFFAREKMISLKGTSLSPKAFPKLVVVKQKNFAC